MGRNVIVTGGGTGIGRAVAAAFASGGDRVVITGRRSAPLENTANELGVNVRPTVCDGTEPEQIERLLSQLPERIDVLVNCAGGNTDFDRVPADSLATLAANWRANLDANLITAVLMTEAVRSRLAQGGAVINIGSIAADKGAGAYGAAKAGLASWNIQLAEELGPHVTANVVSPGYIAETEFFRDMLTDVTRNGLIEAAITRRSGHPDDIAATVQFLSSSGARQITGQVIAVNGGERTTR